MKEGPILFGAPMVRAVLADSKTQTRRVVKEAAMLGGWETGHNSRGDITSRWPLGSDLKPAPCPYGQPGDRLWVREAHAPRADCLVSWQRSMTESYNRMQPTDICYRADEKARDWVEKWRPSIHMPRWASRLLLDITEVRVERLQEISEADAIAEGIVAQRGGGWGLPAGEHFHMYDPRISYWSLWESINGAGTVDTDPWVWAVSFQRTKP